MSKFLSRGKLAVLGALGAVAATGLIVTSMVTAAPPAGTVFAQVLTKAKSTAVATPLAPGVNATFVLSGGTGALAAFDGATTTCGASKDSITLPASPASAGSPFTIAAPTFSSCVTHLGPLGNGNTSIVTHPAGGWTSTYTDGDAGSPPETLGAGDAVTIATANPGGLTATVTLPKTVPGASLLKGCYLKSEAGSVEGAYNDSTGVLTIATATTLPNTFTLDLKENPAKAAATPAVPCLGSTDTTATFGTATVTFTGIYALNPVLGDS